GWLGYLNTDNGYVAEANETSNTQTLTITLPVKPDLTVSNASSGAITMNQNGSYSFPVSFTVTNNGGATAVASWWDASYLSADGTLDNSDLVVGDLQHTTPLAAGASYNVSFTATTAASTAAGTYTLFLKADGRGGWLGYLNTDNGYVAEANETNNTQTLTITLPVKPDLTVSNASSGGITMNQNGSYSFPVSFTVTNNGGATAVASWWDASYLSADGTLDNSDLVVGYLQHTTPLAAGASYNVSFTATTAASTAAGTYTLFLKADGRGGWLGYLNTDNGYVAEANETNNTQTLTITLPVKPDLTVSNASSGGITMNQNGSYSFPVSFTVTNNGGATAVASWWDASYLS